MKRQRKWIQAGIAACLLAIPGLGTTDSSKVQEVTAEGEAEIVDGNVRSARKAALLAAKRSAVEQVGSQIVAETVVEDFELVRDQIISRAQGFVHSFDILDESKRGGTFTVKIKANVSASELADDAQLLYKQMGKPRLMVLITQVEGATEQLSRQVETQLVEYLHNKGFGVIDANTARANLKREEARLIAEGDTKAAAKAALRANAEVVIVGDASVSEAEEVMGGLHSASAQVSARAIQAANARVLAVRSVSRKAVQGSAGSAEQQALRQTAKRSAQELVVEILKAWNRSDLDGRTVTLALRGLKAYKEISRFKQALADLDGVTDVRQRAFDAPTALLEVDFSGSSERLAELLAGKRLGGKQVSITTVESGKLHLELK